MPDEVAVRQPGKRADQHVLWVSRDGGDAADVGRSRHSEQVRQRFQPHPTRSQQCERHHYQADDVVDEERREHTGDEDNSGQQVPRMKPRDDLLGDLVEKTCQMQVADHQHHREQQHQCAEVDETQAK